jgi:Coenzyme PQQ synthesis protein D (PqqD)
MKLRLRDGVFLTETEYGFALLDEDSGRYFNLNATGAEVLRTLLDGGTPARAAEQLTNQYDVDIESAGRDVEELVGQLESANLVQRG